MEPNHKHPRGQSSFGAFTELEPFARGLYPPQAAAAVKPPSMWFA